MIWTNVVWPRAEGNSAGHIFVVDCVGTTVCRRWVGCGGLKEEESGVLPHLCLQDKCGWFLVDLGTLALLSAMGFVFISVFLCLPGSSQPLVNAEPQAY